MIKSECVKIQTEIYEVNYEIRWLWFVRKRYGYYDQVL